MLRRARFPIALLAALVALTMQWCIPLAHAAHRASHVEAAHARHHHHHHDHDGHDDHGDGSRNPHDESRCATCQQFVALRSFAPLTSNVEPIAIDAADVRPSDAYAAPFVAHFDHAPAVPRGPPVR